MYVNQIPKGGMNMLDIKRIRTEYDDVKKKLLKQEAKAILAYQKFLNLIRNVVQSFQLLKI